MTLEMSPVELVSYLSKGKGEAVASKVEDAIISADTFVLFKDIIGKPYRRKSIYYIKNPKGETHSVLTGFTIIDTKENKNTRSETRVSLNIYLMK
jgi:predicted house-cleaning NTP pyrophosphatase (Maf/HAM1 superfamily)